MEVLESNQALWETLAGSVAALPILWYLYRKNNTAKDKCSCSIRFLVSAAAVGAGASVMFRLLFGMIGTFGYEQVEETLLTGNLALQAVVLLLVSPIAEELLFRGILYLYLKKMAAVRHAMWISAFAFGLYHGNLTQGIYACLMGVFLAWTMERSGTIKAPIAVHIASNAAAFMLKIL